MTEYVIIFLFASVLYFKKNEEKPGFGFYIFLILLILISGLRDMIGGYDVYIYSEIYESPYEFLAIYDQFELGFRAYYLFLRIFSDNRHFMLFMTATIMMSLFFYNLKKHSPLVYFSIFILFCKFYLMSFVYLRQGIAMGVVWLALPFIFDRKYIKFFLLILVAFFLHKSSIIFLPMFLLANIRLKNIHLLLIAVIALIVSLTPLSTLLLENLAESVDDSKVSVYISKSGGINFFYLLEALLLVILLLKFKTKFYETKWGTLIMNGFFAYIIISIVALTNASFVRFTWYYFIFLAVALPYIYNFIQDKKSKNAFKLLVFLYFGLLYFRLLFLYDDGDLMPYKTIFQDFNRNGMWEHFEYR